MKKLFYILLILLSAKSGFSQIIDTCFVNETSVYHVKNQQESSFLYWEISDGEIISENPTKSDSIVVLWNVNAGIYELSIYEKTENNCEGKIAVVEIMIIENDFDIELDIPNVFTPNGDGKNDYFTITANRLPLYYQITIFNRWGNNVFENQDINNSWDGMINGEYCSEGVYYYEIQYRDREKIEKKYGLIRVFR